MSTKAQRKFVIKDTRKKSAKAGAEKESVVGDVQWRTEEETIGRYGE
jgi:hypothetical protein